ncbi:hypothetical protein CUMW_100250, partial [Citrus unshiu]
FSFQSADCVLKSNETDQLALLEFKAKVTRDPLHVLSSWNYSRHFCQWKGVTCSPRHQRVTALLLPSLLLQGSLSPHIGNLSFLRRNGEKDDLEFVNSLVNASRLELLAFNINNFGGMLPEAVGSLSTQLKILSVENNQFFGNIPSGLRNLVNLELLHLGDNQFKGQIPGTIGDLLKLQRLTLQGNKFLGEIPPSIGNLTLLTTLNFGENMLEGSIPSSLGKCQNIALLDLSNNNLSGTIPTEVIRLSSLSIYLDLSQNQLNGPFPSNFGVLKNLGVIDISENKLSDDIPNSLENLNLSFNHFEGEVPIKGVFNNSSAISLDGNDNLCGGISELHLSTCSIKESKQSRARSLKPIIPIVAGILLVMTSWLSRVNELVGKVPGKLGSLSKLRILIVHLNSLSGEIPSSLGNLSSLQVLSAAENQFVGQIPETMSQLKRMRYILLAVNKLSGEIPFSIYNLSSLNYICVPLNQLQGTLPSDLGFTLPNLEQLNLGDNQFAGPIPASISNASNLMTLLIDMNGFSGKVPSLENLLKLRRVSIFTNHLGNGEKDDLEFVNSLVNASRLELLEIGDNNFGGMLPEAVGNLSIRLGKLSVAENQLFGNIPSGLRNLVNLELLDLGDNQFTGRIPGRNLTSLAILDFAENMLEGSIPSSLGKCQNLILLDLSKNNLSGTIPTEVIGLPSFSIYLDLSQNQLNGPLPSNFGILKNLGVISLSENKLSGEIPSSLGSCIRLERLVMNEYGMGSEVSTSGDVYSFGILLLEMFTGKRPTNEMFTGNLTLHNFVKEALPERLAEIVDPVLLVEREEGETSKANAHKQWTRSFSVKECLVSVLAIGVTCSSELPRERMSMEEVAAQLLSFRNKLVKNVRGQPATYVTA